LIFYFAKRRKFILRRFCFWNSIATGKIFCVGISLRQFEQMKNRVAGKPAREIFPPVAPTLVARATRQIILGIDPSLRGTGFGVIQMSHAHPQTLAQGTISCPKNWERSRCLAKISETLREVLKKHQPTVCVVEGLFFAQNLQTALIMGEARGAALAVIAEFEIEIFEIATRKVKQAIVGHGAAQKIAVAKMVQRMLNLAELPAPDAADALALALTHARENSRYNLSPLKKI
jgi:crossover junction endodeoxyribonuclease RuvC